MKTSIGSLRLFCTEAADITSRKTVPCAPILDIMPKRYWPFFAMKNCVTKSVKRGTIHTSKVIRAIESLAELYYTGSIKPGKRAKKSVRTTIG